MTLIVSKWIHKTLGIEVNSDIQSLANFARNPHFIALLLLAHQVISEKQANKVLSTDPMNLSQLEKSFRGPVRKWLEAINIKLSSEEILSILYKNENAAVLRLFQIYLALNPANLEVRQSNQDQSSHLDILLRKCRETRESLYDNEKCNVSIQISNIKIELQQHKLRSNSTINSGNSEIELGSVVLDRFDKAIQA